MAKVVIKDIQLLRVLVKRFNFSIIRQKGSHVRLTDGTHKVTIAIHNKELQQGTLNAILHQAGLAKESLFDE